MALIKSLKFKFIFIISVLRYESVWYKTSIMEILFLYITDTKDEPNKNNVCFKEYS